MSKPRSSVKGNDKVKKGLTSLLRDLEKKQLQSIKVEAELIMTDSKANYVPVDKGTLRQSGTIGDPVRKGDEITISMGYGGAAAAYATALHEHPSESSPPTWEGKALTFTKPGTGPKYLEQPLMKAVDGMAERLASRIKLKD